MDKQKVLVKLMWDLQSFLSVLDSENLSYIAQAQKKSISELLAKLQMQDTPVEDAEYMIMSCPSSSPSNDLTDAPGSEDVLQPCSDPVSNQESRKGSQGPVVPPHPPGGLDADDEDDEDTYEEAEPFIPDTTTTNTDKANSDSSHYESYGEEGEEEEEEFVKDRAHYIQWSASQPCLRPTPESRLCGYLWRKKWLGQWSKQLFVIRNSTLLCYKCAKDLHPQLELALQGCTVAYKAKHSSKMQHELKVTAGCETLVLGFNSCQQAEEWRKVLEEVSGSVYCELETHSSSSLLKSDRPLSCRSSTVLQTDSEDEKPSASNCLDQEKGFMNVLMNCQWQSLLCQVEAGLLKMFGEEGEGEERGGGERAPQYTVQLRGCDVKPGPDTAQAYRITLSQHGDQMAVLEVSCSDEKDRWLQLLQDGAVNQNRHDNNSTLDNTGGALSGLKTRRFPTSNMYMDDPFHLSGTDQQPIYSNTSLLEHMFQTSQDVVQGDSVSSKNSVTYSNTVFTNHSRKPCEAERSVQKLELTGKRRVQLRAGSEMNLASTGKQNKRTSFRQSLAFCTERAQAGFLSPLLRRTASAKTSLRRAPSALFIEHGKVFQRKKEWETKTAA